LNFFQLSRVVLGFLDLFPNFPPKILGASPWKIPFGSFWGLRDLNLM
jgi:hypothetical protein